MWQRIADSLATVDQDYGERPSRAAYRRYAIGLLRPALAAMGKTPRAGEAADVPVSRARLIETLGAFGDGEVLADARATMANDAGTPGDRRTAQTILSARADAATFDALLAQTRASDDPFQKLRLDVAHSDRIKARLPGAILPDQRVPRPWRHALPEQTGQIRKSRGFTRCIFRFAAKSPISADLKHQEQYPYVLP